MRNLIRAAQATMILTLFTFAQHPACAQSLEEQELAQRNFAQLPSTGNWNATLGAAVAAAPLYPGAGSDRTRVIPLAEVIYRDTFFLGTAGFGMNAIDTGGLRIGPVIGYMAGRDQYKDQELYGLGDIHSSLTAGLFADYRAGAFELGGTVRQAVTHTSDGMLGLVQLDYRGLLPRGHVLFLVGPELEFADGQYARTWYGVAPDQSNDSGLPVFAPRAGLTDFGLHAMFDCLLSDHLVFRVFGNIKQTAGNISESPIVQHRAQALFGAGFAYHF
jgi:outer membrane scaffolding protein for murein synthesis (MipA/OmpV family)